jgi:flagellar basal body-associated protein FliL
MYIRENDIPVTENFSAGRQTNKNKKKNKIPFYLLAIFIAVLLVGGSWLTFKLLKKPKTSVQFGFRFY